MGASMSRYIVKLLSRTISYEWWGQQWCQNIAAYADYSNRLERGRAYIRKGAVKEISIEYGHVSAMVEGTAPQDYKVDISINQVSDDLSEKLLRQIKDINDLKNGKVPENYKNLFTVDNGIFPKANEIKFTCSCPDIACMCKHVAAVLYAIGSILDQEPLLIFQLRGIDVEAYIDKQIFNATNEILIDINNHADDERVINDAMLADLFGIEIATEINESIEQVEGDDINEEAVRVIEILPKSKRKKISYVHKQRKNPLEGYVIRQYTLEGFFVKEYGTYEEVESDTSVGILNVKRVCSGVKQSAGGYQWKKVAKGSPVANTFPIETPRLSGFSKPIESFDDKGNMIAHYESVTEAVRSTGINSKSIRDAAKGVQKHAGGLVWKYCE
jgi:uncharacterized Zn finger protein